MGVRSGTRRNRRRGLFVCADGVAPRGSAVANHHPRGLHRPCAGRGSGTLCIILPDATGGLQLARRSRTLFRLSVENVGHRDTRRQFAGLQHRARTIARLGTPLAFLSRNEIATAYTQAYAPYVHARLQDTQRTRIAGIQALVPPNEPIVAWVMTPFWFDFRRNPIYHTDPFGLAMPWTKILTARYFVWEYAGGVVRPEQRYVEMMNDSGASERVAGARALAFIRDLETRVKTALSFSMTERSPFGERRNRPHRGARRRPIPSLSTCKPSVTAGGQQQRNLPPASRRPRPTVARFSYGARISSFLPSSPRAPGAPAKVPSPLRRRR